MEKLKDLIELENGEVFNVSQIVKVRKHYMKAYNENDDIEPYYKKNKGEYTRSFFGIPFGRAKYDCYISVCSYVGGPSFGGKYEGRYYSLKSLFNAIIEHWGEQTGTGYYSHLPVAEAVAGFRMSETKDAITFDEEKNEIIVKPYVALYFDDFNEAYTGFGHFLPRRKFFIFDTDEEMDKWIEENLEKKSVA